jgi:hypothetical protein
VMPSNRMVMPLNQWPHRDRILWEAGIAPQSGLRRRRLHAETLQPKSIEHAREGYGRFLAVLADQQILDTNLGPDERVTFETVAVFFNALEAAGNVRNTIKARLFHTRMALRIMTPEVDFNWVTRPEGCALDSLLPQEQKQDKFTPDARTLFAWGLSLMELPDESLWPRLPYKRIKLCRTFRDGLIIGLLACRAPRLGSLAQMRLGSNLYALNQEYWARLESSIVKNKNAIEYSLPAQLTPYIARYVKEIRPQLLDPERTDALWGNGDGGLLTYQAIETMIRRRTARDFEQCFGPHRFRDAFASTLAAADHQNPGLAAVVLGITEGVVHAHYRQARQTDAARKLQKNLREERERTSAIAQRAFNQYR